MGRTLISRTVQRVLAGALLGVELGAPDPVRAGPLPVPCVATNCGPTSPAFVTSGKATATQTGNNLTVNQATNTATLNWASFNIGPQGSVQFVQPAASSIALNRIFQESPSSIFGQLTANGQVFLVNPNGFLFGKTAQVNVAGLIASSLGISDSTFKNGLLTPIGNSQAALQSDGRTVVEDNQGNPLPGPDGQPQPVQVVVQQGAQISAPGGRILLAGQNVSNAGTLSAPDGQVILAAGQSVYLQASTDSSLRGLVVEVDQGGKAWNQLSGQISADRGNVSLVGLAVNQDGRISATTSVSANGSVRLEAADTAEFNVNSVGEQSGSFGIAVGATHGGTLELGPASSIEIQPEYSSSATAPTDPTQPQLPSKITLVGEQVFLEGGSISAHNGQLEVVAAANPSASGVGVVTDGNPAAQIRVHAGTSIDLSGSVAELPMSANLLPLQLRANELADDPTQRGGALYGQTVYIDARVGTSIVGAAALTQAENAVPRNVAYRTTAGGSASFESEGDVVIERGAAINVSGGQTNYDGGVLQTTQLVGANGQLYDIGSANPLATYTGVLNPTFTQTYNKWGVQTVAPTPGLSHYESGYVQGSSAGSITVAAPVMVLDGTLEGEAVNGPLQRSGPSVAHGGTLILGLQGGLPSNGVGFLDYLTPAIEFTNQPPQIAVLDGAAVPSQPLQLPTEYLESGGFTRTVIYGNSSVTLPVGTPLGLLPGSSLQIEAPRIEVLSDITALGGNVQLQSNLSYLYNASLEPLPLRAGIEIGDGVDIDVRGQWTNDSPLLGGAPAYAPTFVNGGRIALSLGDAIGGELVVGNDVALRASGGAWLSGSNKLTGGSGGSISIQASPSSGSNPLNSALQLGNGIELDAYGTAGAAGGSFALSAPRIAISSGPAGTPWSGAQRVDDLTAPGGVLGLDASLFSQYGFSSVALATGGAVAPGAASGDVLTVMSGSAITASAQTQQLDPGFMLRASGGTIAGFSQLLTLPLAQQTPSTVSLTALPQASTATPARLDVQAGSSITTGPGGSIQLVGVGGVYVDGTLRAPGGTITLQAPTPGVIDPAYADPGYVAAINVELGSQGVLDASGTLVAALPNNLGLTLGTVLNGGAVNLLGDRGAVFTDPGSVIDIAGTAALLDVPTALGSGIYNLYNVGSSAGSLNVRSGVSVSLGGSLRAAAGAGNYGNPAGGSLAVVLTERDPAWFDVPPTVPTPYPAGPFVIQLVDGTQGAPQTSQTTNLALLGVANLEASRIDTLQLLSQNNIEFSANTPLTLARAGIFDAPVMTVDDGVNATVSGNYLQLNNSQIVAAAPGSLLPGTGTLTLGAPRIDLVGNVGVSGAQLVSLITPGDVLLRGVIAGPQPFLQGSLTLDGSLTIDAARIYPATATDFTIQTLSPGDTVTLQQTLPSPGTPLSAGGSVSIFSDRIASFGTLLAPFGNITLAATSWLDLAPGSLTSVSGAGSLIPYGQTQLGQQQWVTTANGASVISGIPQRGVQLQAPSLTIASGATVDLQGGGDLYAYEWIPGTGGTKDALLPGTIPGLYAILPSTLGQFGPYDPGEMAGSSLQPGASIYLSGGDGLAAGIYPLLPARYALLPGAYLVQVQSGYSNLAPGQQASLADGTPVIAGYLTFGTTNLHSGGYQGVAVWPGSHGQQLAEYNVSLASSFFPAAAAAAGQPLPSLPADAGQLSMAVEESLNVAGTVLGNSPGSAGKASTIDVSAPNIEVTASASEVLPSGTVGIPASVINSWQPGELVLGGHPTQPLIAQGGTTGGAASVLPIDIAVQADTVTIGKGAQLEAGQVILVANQSIDLQPGSSVLSTSGASGGRAPAQPAVATPFFLSTGSGSAAAPDNGAALLAVSDAALPLVQRTGAAATVAGIDVESGATVSSRGAIAIDAPGSVTLAGTLSGPGASWSLASSSIGFVGSGSSADSLQVTSPVEASLQGAGSIALSSLGPINLYVPVQLGGLNTAGAPSLTALTLGAQSLNDLAPAGASTFTAQTLMLEGATQNLGTSGASAAAATQAAGAISFNAGEFDLGSGSVAISGVAQTNIAASSLFAARGASGTANGINTTGNLSIMAPLLTAANGASAQVSAPGGALSIGTPGGSTPVPAGYLGGELDFSAASISQGSAIIVPAGVVSMSAAGDINLGSGALISTSGPELAIASQTVGTAGGRITLTAGGNLGLASGSSLDVSASAGAPAGEIVLAAGGSANLAGSLRGAASSAAQGGSFSVDAAGLSQSLSALSDGLLAGGFNDVVSVRAHTGDLTVDAGHELAASSVTLIADGGSVDIGGTVSAPGAGVRGEIQLFGGQGVVIGPAAQLLANASGAGTSGGTIELGAGASGSVMLDSGSTVSASGPLADGTLLIRAPLVGGNSIAATLDGGGAGTANLSQLAQIIVEPVITEIADRVRPGTMTATDWTRIKSDVTNKMNGALSPITTTIDGELSAAAAPLLLVRPAVDVVGSGALTIAAAPNFATWRYGDQPVDLTVRAGGALTVATTLSDGFTTAQIRFHNRLTPITVLTAGPNGTVYYSADIRLVAGADSASPDPLATVSVYDPPPAGAALPASLTIASGKAVRTGTGEIDVVAAGNVVFGAANATTPGAEVYTGGLPGAAFETLPLSISTFNFPTAGGNVLVNAGGNVIGAPVLRSTQNPTTPSPTSWLISEGGSAAQLTQWGVDLNAYGKSGWNVASLGGGDVIVRSGGDVSNLSAAAADSYFSSPVSGTPTLQPSGGLVVSARGDIATGEFYVADGSGVLTAGGAFSAAPRPGDSGAGSLIALGDAQVSVNARLGVLIDGVVNPTTLVQAANSPGFASGFFTYTENSALEVQSTTGAVILEDSHAPTLLGAAVANGYGGQGRQIYPATVTATAATGDLVLGQATLFASSNGQLQLIAGHDIDYTGSSTALEMSDALPAQLPGVQNPGSGALTNLQFSPFVSGAHVNDPNAALVIAGQDIDNLNLSVPKATDIVAGRDVVNLTFAGQNLNPGDLTLISAGRDVIDPVSLTNTGELISVGGPGRVDVIAGRNFDLGLSAGLQTTGNLDNANLPIAGGASLTVMAGLGQSPDYGDFLSKIVAPSASYQQQLVSYVEGVTGQSGLPFASAEQDFSGLSADLRRALLNQIFFEQLQLSGIQDNTVPGAGFTLGYAAIDALFPNSRTAVATGPSPYAGNVSLSFSKIYTDSGGTISIIAPGGSLNVGLATVPAALQTSVQRNPSDLGIVAEGTGDVDIYSRGDVNVNASRVFTLGGGNILIWSDEGNIDAGKGAKTSVSAPPPQISVAANGTITETFFGAVAGSGIRTIQALPGVPPGDVNLIAPEGTVNAGDAGIGAAGNINIAAQHVLGLDNIQFGGTATGVPAQVSDIGVALSGAAGLASSATNAAMSSSEDEARKNAAAAPQAQAAIGWLDVFVVGLGEENCSAQDAECLKRQKKN